MPAAGGGSRSTIAACGEAMRPHLCFRGLCLRWDRLHEGTVLPASRAGVLSDWSPWETPSRQRLAEGRPHLAAGIRAASYAPKCSNPGFRASIEQLDCQRFQIKIGTHAALCLSVELCFVEAWKYLSRSWAGCARPAGVFRMLGAARMWNARWPILGFRRFRCSSCRASRSSLTSGTRSGGRVHPIAIHSFE